jgi:NAD(P)-dependent dehydrogenase (short-subunit alcohol dehydrogenase family)
VNDLKGRIAWVTGAGSGIGEAAALALAREGMKLVLTGRQAQPLAATAARSAELGATALVRPGDVGDPEAVAAIAGDIGNTFGRLDVLVNNAGINIPDRSWQRLTPSGTARLIQGNLTSAFYVVQAVLPIMRAQGHGLLIHTASWAGRFVGPVAGPAYIAAKHGVVAMSHSLNLEECENGIRSTVICPGEVATPIMVNRPVPETPESLARMIQPQDVGELIVFLAKQPAHVCTNEVVISPAYNRGYIAMMRGRRAATEHS